MRILLAGTHAYPMSHARSAGRTVIPFPSGSAQRLQDWTAKGLAELGHDVDYYITNRVIGPAPKGVRTVDHLDLKGVDVAHIQASMLDLASDIEAAGVPYVASVHIHPATRPGLSEAGPHAVFVSRWLAAAHGSTRFVLNGVDPSEYRYSSSKSDYLLFMSSMDWAKEKGIGLAIAVARRTATRLIVAGGTRTEEALEAAISFCDTEGVDYVGDVQGIEKRDLLAGAKALLYPSTYAESCPLTIIEAMISGTPVVATPHGGTPELVTPDIGFLCETEDDFVMAVNRLATVDPQACRARALRDFHYRRMANDYLREYEAAIARRAAPDELAEPAFTISSAQPSFN